MLKRKETIYRCEHCGKHYHNADSCRNHEKICFSNPKIKNCNTCVYGGRYTLVCGLTKENLKLREEPVRLCGKHVLAEAYMEEEAGS